jgi:hypothetical protein
MENRKIVPLVKREMLKFMLDNYNKSIEIKNVCDNALREAQKEHLENPSVYMSVMKRADNPNLKYVTAKTLFPVAINKFKEYRYYVGTLSDFPLGAKDKRAKLLGEQIIKENLVKKYKSITFTL